IKLLRHMGKYTARVDFKMSYVEDEYGNLDTISSLKAQSSIRRAMTIQHGANRMPFLLQLAPQKMPIARNRQNGPLILIFYISLLNTSNLRSICSLLESRCFLVWNLYRQSDGMSIRK